jgi:hypothetical protein
MLLINDYKVCVCVCKRETIKKYFFNGREFLFFGGIKYDFFSTFCACLSYVVNLSVFNVKQHNFFHKIPS